MSNFRSLAVVTATLEHILQDAGNQAVASTDVRIGAPTAKLSEEAKAVINIFLFRVLPSAHMRNDHFPTRDSSGAQRARARLALDLYYVLSFYGDAAKFEPERLFGAAALALDHSPGLSVAAMEAASSDTANQAALAGADLAAEGKAIGLDADSPSLEEWSKIWSVFFQVPYALSAIYVVRGVIIETQDQLAGAIPVASPEIFVATMGPLRIGSAGPSPGETGPIAWGATLHLAGVGIARFGNSLRVDGEARPLGDSAIVGDGLALPLEPALFGGTTPKAGAHELQVVAAPAEASMPERLRRGSNTIPFAILPVIGQVDRAVGPGSGAGLRSGTVTVEVEPPLQSGQSATLLLNGVGAGPTVGIALEPMPPAVFPAAQIVFPFSDLAARDYFLRLEVDGFASQPELGSDPDEPDFGRIVGPLVDLT